MKSASAIDTLRDLAEQDLEKAVIHLGDMRRGVRQADEQLNMLLDYQDEYRNKLNNDMSGGIATNRWTNYHQFIQTLEKAIEQHRAQLNHWNQRLEQALTSWREKQQRLNAYQTLISRAADNALRVENRLDQKRMDEYAQRAALRKGE
ncbi:MULTISPECIES: flagellar export protein FliJ [Pantoea]|jgi:flagellar FliJ protein|uniref:Flagellar FliJ protein n=1 Tax=Pantoea piersonii TaxID=2364647 RepID=A0AAJ5QLP7_9GAMM|nr:MULTISPECIES: flagellar export protein FliJ [Pantoea]HCW98684.1 flagellar biosynthesis chaperone FliJ [Pantoea sp.]MBZ6385471.1 flagella biosynthesis chaperone FliJ [Pantoea piersonii]MBZ6398985.1 flagella biosynthesis chaperone FliJ [Pantoea piersonii]MBZ6407517.1 flagella biosynthesis chaperone FliJ [Pantoea piersonii]MBZ6425532.1 flagella biosynthesis chaperone FliJ [Pantoea piersonii]